MPSRPARFLRDLNLLATLSLDKSYKNGSCYARQPCQVMTGCLYIGTGFGFSTQFKRRGRDCDQGIRQSSMEPRIHVTRAADREWAFVVVGGLTNDVISRRGCI